VILKYNRDDAFRLVGYAVLAKENLECVVIYALGVPRTKCPPDILHEILDH
jgi:hypothetical protein